MNNPNSGPPYEWILFLDLDGVLHPEGVGAELEFCHLDIFEQVMREFPQVQIVVSSSCRLGESIEDLRSHFSIDIQDRIVGITPRLPEFDSMRGQRQRECEAWVSEHRPQARWLALDDRAQYFDAGCQRLVLILHVHDSGAGLEGAYVETLRQKIAEMLELVVIDPAAMVLARSVTRCSHVLGLDTNTLADVLGLDPNFIEDMQRGVAGLDPSGRHGELANTLIRCVIALHSLVGGNTEMMTAWLNSFNSGVKAVPIELMRQNRGLKKVAEYLESLLQTGS
ncbi:MAG: hypothetical protein KJ852_16600 [Gammaproteobacteria bacterium]|nr:hypothetical protein [Gammaproteobacteria bacterium]MBU0786843.1 hypothetical protein [Gammaproteobacteria bacterium]MBU0813951.1 hypothetical protein [Gammaproteobacteria bacterium]MBU1788576.1 hypothetical protein [Gammaproteobacteria bacterium]